MPPARFSYSLRGAPRWKKVQMMKPRMTGKLLKPRESTNDLKISGDLLIYINKKTSGQTLYILDIFDISFDISVHI